MKEANIRLIGGIWKTRRGTSKNIDCTLQSTAELMPLISSSSGNEITFGCGYSNNQFSLSVDLSSQMKKSGYQNLQMRELLIEFNSEAQIMQKAAPLLDITEPLAIGNFPVLECAKNRIVFSSFSTAMEPEVELKPTELFSDYALTHPNVRNIVNAIANHITLRSGITTPKLTIVQQEGFNAVLNKKHLVICAPGGAGKTSIATFALLYSIQEKWAGSPIGFVFLPLTALIFGHVQQLLEMIYHYAKLGGKPIRIGLYLAKEASPRSTQEVVKLITDNLTCPEIGCREKLSVDARLTSDDKVVLHCSRCKSIIDFIDFNTRQIAKNNSNIIICTLDKVHANYDSNHVKYLFGIPHKLCSCGQLLFPLTRRCFDCGADATRLPVISRTPVCIVFDEIDQISGLYAAKAHWLLACILEYCKCSGKMPPLRLAISATLGNPRSVAEKFLICGVGKYAIVPDITSREWKSKYFERISDQKYLHLVLMPTRSQRETVIKILQHVLALDPSTSPLREPIKALVYFYRKKDMYTCLTGARHEIRVLADRIAAVSGDDPSHSRRMQRISWLEDNREPAALMHTRMMAGIDFKKIHLVVHFGTTANLDEIYQENRRAGRKSGQKVLVLYVCDPRNDTDRFYYYYPSLLTFWDPNFTGRFEINRELRGVWSGMAQLLVATHLRHAENLWKGSMITEKIRQGQLVLDGNYVKNIIDDVRKYANS